MVSRREPGRVAVYVTSHGFGHLNRSVAVINRIPDDIPVTIRSHPSLFEHWGERLRRPADLEAHTSDAGAVNPPGDSMATDGPTTLARAAAVHAEAMARVDDDADRLRSEGTAAVLCDATPVPLVAARRAGIPGYLLANFAWSEIYTPHARKIGPAAQATTRAIRTAYRHATAIFRAQPALVMKGLAPMVDVGMVVTPGRDRRSELIECLGLPPATKLVYSYLGRYGQDNLEWERLERLANDGVHFVGFHEPPRGPVAGVHVVPATEWTGADLAASCDVIVAKAGYGTVCEAIVANKPLIYPPRVGFAEHRALVWAMNAWGGGLAASRRDFERFRLEKLIARGLELKPGPAPFPATGAQTIADHLTRVCRGLVSPLDGLAETA